MIRIFEELLKMNKSLRLKTSVDGLNKQLENQEETKLKILPIM